MRNWMLQYEVKAQGNANQVYCNQIPTWASAIISGILVPAWNQPDRFSVIRSLRLLGLLEVREIHALIVTAYHHLPQRSLNWARLPATLLMWLVSMYACAPPGPGNVTDEP